MSTDDKTPRKRDRTPPDPTQPWVPKSKHAKPNAVPGVGKGRLFTPDRWEIFLAEFAKYGLMGVAARAADVVPETIRQHRLNVPEFAEMYEQALQDYRETLEREVHRRAVEGWDEPVYQKGEMVGTIRRHSDRMLELLTKRHIAEYRDKVSVDANVTGGVMVVPAAAKDADDWEARFGEKARGTTRSDS